MHTRWWALQHLQAAHSPPRPAPQVYLEDAEGYAAHEVWEQLWGAVGGPAGDPWVALARVHPADVLGSMLPAVIKVSCRSGLP